MSNLDAKVLRSMDFLPDDDMQAIFDCLDRGLAPSAIDALRGYKTGTSHDAIVEYWMVEKELKAEEAKIMKMRSGR